jgi:hypothetical protein
MRVRRKEVVVVDLVAKLKDMINISIQHQGVANEYTW